ncbi:hypothetical protein [Saccharothrix syringae]|uniref:hypothetical protein n=1 Tax=Saccharothrix syringae TaxID=103733 RepID=UPI000AF79C2A|nr:hypothetical protein [Saccharothrix syringae]
MDKTDIEALHKRAELLGVLHHERMNPDELRTAVDAREHGADPRQAQEHVQRERQP